VQKSAAEKQYPYFTKKTASLIPIESTKLKATHQKIIISNKKEDISLKLNYE
jgi:hypothetical protein